MAIFSAIGGVIATSVLGLAAGTSAFAIASATIGGALAFGAKTLVNGYLNRRKSRNYSAVQGEVELGSNVPASTVYGKGKVKGHRIYYAKWGAGDKSNTDVFVLANGWCDGLEPYVYFYGEKHALYEIPPIGNETKFYGVVGFENIISFRFYDGRPGQLADQRLVDFTANLGNPWKTTSVCTGLTYVIVERFYDEKFGNGRPDIEFVLRGLREYDPRYDSTIAGGEGAQRIDDPSTWIHTENPAVHRLNYQLGLRGRVSNRTIIGEGKSLGQLDLASYFASMNVCDTPIDGKPTYQASLIVTADDDHTEVLKEFDDAMAGYGLNRRGLSGVIAGAPQIPVLEITADDIDMGRAKQIKRRKSAFELYNHISGQFTSIEDQWNPASLTPVYVNADVAADGRSRQTANDFLQVTDPDIAQRLLSIRYRQQRLGGKFTVPVSRRVGLKVQEGQWVESDGLEWLIVGWNCDAQFRFTLDLAETSASVYSEGGIEPGPIVLPSVPPVNPSLISTVQNFNVIAGFEAGEDGLKVPALIFTWDPPEDPSITQVRFEYVIDPVGEIQRDAMDAPETGYYRTTKNVVSSEIYSARATITTVPDRIKTFTPWKLSAARTSDRIATVLNGAINELKLADRAVSSAKIQVAAILEELLAPSSVTQTKIADAAVAAAAIQDQAVTALKLADAAVTNAKVAVDAIGSGNILNGSVIAGKIAAAAVEAGNIVDGAVIAGKIATAAVGAANIVDGAVIAGKIGSAAVTQGAIAVDAVLSGNIAEGAVLSGKIAEAAVVGSKLSEGAVTEGKISAGAVVSSKLAVGFGGNLLLNTDFGMSTDHWESFSSDGGQQYTFFKRPAGQPWGGANGTLVVRQNNGYSAVGAYIDVNPRRPAEVGTGFSTWYSVTEGDRWEISANISTHRCTALIAIAWLDQNGTFVTASQVAHGEDPSDETSPDNWPRVFAQGNVPAGVFYGAPIFRKYATTPGFGYTDSWLFIHKPMFTRIPQNATEPALYAPGGGTMVDNNGIVTNAVTASKILAGTITGDKIAAGTITAGLIQGGTITGDKIAGGTITGGLIAAGTITGDKFVAGSITARELTLTDYENGFVDNQMQSPALWSTPTGWTIEVNGGGGLPSIGSANYIKPGGSTGQGPDLQGPRSPVDASSEYRITAFTYGNGAFSPSVYVVWYGASDNYLSYVDLSNSYQVFNNAIVEHSLNVMPPFDAKFVRVFARDYDRSLGHTVFALGGISLRKRNRASLIVDGAITAEKIQSKAVLTDKLAVGLSSNILFNSTFSYGLSGWAIYPHPDQFASSQLSIRPVGDSWASRTNPTLQMYNPGIAPLGSYTDLRQIRPDADGLPLPNWYPCVAGRNYEASIYASAHRCGVEIRLEFVDANGSAIFYSEPASNYGNQASSDEPETWPRLVTRAIAPANARGVTLHLRRVPVGQAEEYAFLYKPMLAEVPVGVTEAMPWQDGSVTLVTGGAIKTGAVTAIKIETGSITGDRIQAGAITAGLIQSGTITAAQIQAGTITAALIQGGTITGDKMVAGSLTTRELLVTDWSNLADQGFSKGNYAAWNFNGSDQVTYYDGGSEPSVGYSGGYLFRTNAPGFCMYTKTDALVPVNGGDEYLLDVFCYNTSGGDQSLWAMCYDVNGVNFANLQATASNLKNQWMRLTGRIAVPPQTHRIGMLCYRGEINDGGYSFWSKPSMRRAAGANMIVDGAITANKIQAGTITGSMIQAGSITGDQIQAGAVTAAKMNIGSLAAISAVLGNVDISNAIIGSLIVGESNIGFKSMTEPTAISNGGSWPSSNGNRNYTTVATLPTAKLVGGFVQVDGSFTLSTNGATNSRANIQARIFRVDTGQEIWVSQLYTLQGANQGPNSVTIPIVRDFAMDNGESPGGSGQYVLQILNSNMGGTATASWSLTGKLLLWKK